MTAVARRPAASLSRTLKAVGATMNPKKTITPSQADSATIANILKRWLPLH
jgi:hypothetical protein